MIVTKEHQEALVDKYVKEKHNQDECIGFIDGLNAALELVKNLTIPVVSSCESSVQLFKLECLNEDGDIENNGYYKTREEAEKVKAEMDAWPGNTKYGIKQNVIEIETED